MPITRPANHMGYMPSLDGVRAFAVLAVMGTHSNLAEFRGGGLGVDVFFVLSGLLITKLLLQEFDDIGSVALGKFYARRFLRLFPALVLVLAAVTAYVLFVAVEPVRSALTEEIVAAAFYIRHLTWSFDFAMDDIFLGHTWSLGVEEQFYFLWPPVLLLLLRRGVGLRLVLGGVVVTALSMSLLVPLGLGSTWLRGLMVFRPAAILFGVALAIVYHLVPRPDSTRTHRTARILAYGGAAYLSAAVVFPETFRIAPAAGADQLVISTTATAIFVGLLYSPPFLMSRLLENRVLVAIGQISYGVYLWHLPIFRWFNRFGPELNPKIHILLEFGLTFVVAGISYYFMERYFLKLKPR